MLCQAVSQPPLPAVVFDEGGRGYVSGGRDG